MSKQVEAEGSYFSDYHSLGLPLITFKVKYNHLDFLHMLYVCIVIPLVTLLTAFTFGFAIRFQLNENLYYVLAGIMIALYVSVVYIDWARNYRPILLPPHKNLCVHVFLTGFVRSLNGHDEVVFWQDITRIHYYRSDEAGGDELASKLKVWRSDGKKFVFDSNIVLLDTLASLVEREYAHCQGPRTETALQ